MRTDVAESTRSGEFLLHPPGEWRLGVDEPVLQILGADLSNFADLALEHKFTSERYRWNPTIGESDHREDATLGCAPRRVGHHHGFIDGVGHWFFAQDVLAGGECGDRNFGMRVSGRDDVDHVDIVAFDHFAPIQGVLRPPPLRGSRSHRW